MFFAVRGTACRVQEHAPLVGDAWYPVAPGALILKSTWHHPAPLPTHEAVIAPFFVVAKYFASLIVTGNLSVKRKLIYPLVVVPDPYCCAAAGQTRGEI